MQKWRNENVARKPDNRISYIRKPMAEHSYLCIGLAFVGLLFAAAGMGFSIYHQGNTPLYAASMCLSSLLFSAAASVYGWKSFKEEEKNYLLAQIGGAVSFLLMVVWLVIILIGFRG